MNNYQTIYQDNICLPDENLYLIMTDRYTFPFSCSLLSYGDGWSQGSVIIICLGSSCREFSLQSGTSQTITFTLFNLVITRTYTTFADEESFSIYSGIGETSSPLIYQSGENWNSTTTTNTTLVFNHSLGDGIYTLILKDSGKNGWSSGSYISLQGSSTNTYNLTCEGSCTRLLFSITSSGLVLHADPPEPSILTATVTRQFYSWDYYYGNQEYFAIASGIDILYVSPQSQPYQQPPTVVTVNLNPSVNHQYTLILNDGQGNSWDNGNWIYITGANGNVVVMAMMTGQYSESIPFSL